MTEHAYIRKVHRRLARVAPEVYVWKINDRYEGGVADAYYSDKADLWVEYKFLKALPKRPTTVISTGLSQLQKEWLRARHAQGRAVCVIIGTPNKSLVLPGLSWDTDITAAAFINSSVDISAVVSYIEHCTSTADAHPGAVTQEGLHEQSKYHPARPRKCSPPQSPVGSP